MYLSFFMSSLEVWNESLNSEDQQNDQYHQNEQS